MHPQDIQHRAFVILACLICLSVAGACATAKPISSGAPLDPSRYRIIERVPFFPQEDFQCGPSCLAGVLNHYGKNLSPRQIANEILHENIRGTLSIDMVIYARDQGFHADWYTGSEADLRETIDKNHPLIAMVDLGFGPVRRPHFLVVTGYGQDGVIVNSGKHRQRLIPWKQFLGQWRRAEFWTLQIVPGALS
jgi:ABC-type bacteriocin/lantibiotic exporter with double-glycine peptidase domain